MTQTVTAARRADILEEAGAELDGRQSKFGRESECRLLRRAFMSDSSREFLL